MVLIVSLTPKVAFEYFCLHCSFCILIINILRLVTIIQLPARRCIYTQATAVFPVVRSTLVNHEIQKLVNLCVITPPPRVTRRQHAASGQSGGI